jgi:hypothetical protein
LLVWAAPIASADEQADYRVLCDIWRKTDPETGKEKQEVTPDERALLLREVVSHRNNHGQDFRRMAAITLGNLRAAEATDKLVDLLQDPKEDNMTSAEAAVALGKIGESKALLPLLDALMDDRPCIRTHAAQGLRLLKLNADQMASAATAKRFNALLDKADTIALPKSEREWLDSDSTASNQAYATAQELDALSVGLKLARPAEIQSKDVERSKRLAAKFLAAGFPAIAYQSETMLPGLRSFCQENQPEIFAKKVASR